MSNESDSRIKELTSGLNLIHLNAEAGLFSVIQVSDLEVTCADARSPVSNAIYFMLTREEPQNYVHWLYSDDYQTFIEGGPADYYIFHSNGSTEKFTMGRDIESGQTLVVPCPANSAKAIVLHEDASHLLVSSVVTPAWSPQRARIGGDDRFIQKYSGSSDWASPEFLTFLIGPNFGHELGADGEMFSVTVDEKGQIIWKGMQLNEKQVAVELKNFLKKTPESAFQISIHPNAPQTIIDRLKNLASHIGIRETKLTQISMSQIK
jgi:uncharacterized protein